MKRRKRTIDVRSEDWAVRRWRRSWCDGIHALNSIDHMHQVRLVAALSWRHGYRAAQNDAARRRRKRP